MSMRIYVQGSRKPDEGMTELIRQFGIQMRDRGCTCLVGSKGDIPRILEKVGVPCIWYAASEFPSDAPGNRTRCYASLALTVNDDPEFQHWYGPVEVSRIGWALRLVDWAANADAYMFFPGAEGTLAHFFSTVAFAMRDAEEGKPKRFVLIGWPDEQIGAIRTLFDFNAPGREWFHHFPADHVNLAVDFLLQDA
ncbi:MAG: hypothetical protein V1685_00170 [Parcubacteria group bacterium]